MKKLVMDSSGTPSHEECYCDKCGKLIRDHSSVEAWGVDWCESCWEFNEKMEDMRLDMGHDGEYETEDDDDA